MIKEFNSLLHTNTMRFDSHLDFIGHQRMDEKIKENIISIISILFDCALYRRTLLIHKLRARLLLTATEQCKLSGPRLLLCYLGV